MPPKKVETVKEEQGKSKSMHSITQRTYRNLLTKPRIANQFKRWQKKVSKVMLDLTIDRELDKKDLSKANVNSSNSKQLEGSKNKPADKKAEGKVVKG